MIASIADITQSTIYSEIVEIITRENPDTVHMHILAAEDVAKSYLFKYDLKALFGSESSSPSVDSPLVKKIVIALASYDIVKLANPNIDIELFRQAYDSAIALLEAIRDGRNILFGVPLASDDPDTPSDEGYSSVSWSSNPKRTNFF